VASLLEMAAAESQPAPATRVVAGGSVGDSTLTPAVIGAATDIVLVARIGADTVARVLALRAATASSAAPVVAAFTYRRSRTARFGKHQPKEQRSAPSPPADVVDDERSAE
jgi:hypothetical protein